MSGIGSKVIETRFPLLRGGSMAMMMLVAFFACGVLFQMNGTSILDDYLVVIGVLKSMGASNAAIVTIFAAIDLFVQTLVILAGFLWAKLIILALNLGVMKSGVLVFSSFSTFHRLHAASIFALGCIVILSIVIRGLRTTYTICRYSPDRLIRE